MPASPDGIMASDDSIFGSLAFAGGGVSRLAERRAVTNKEESRKSLACIESLPVMLIVGAMLDGIGLRCQDKRLRSSAAPSGVRRPVREALRAPRQVCRGQAA